MPSCKAHMRTHTHTQQKYTTGGTAVGMTFEFRVRHRTESYRTLPGGHTLTTAVGGGKEALKKAAEAQCKNQEGMVQKCILRVDR